MKVTIPESITEKNIRLKATNNSATFGFVTASSQILLGENNFSLSNYDNQRIVTTSSVTSLADDIISVSGLNGEDLIFVSSGNSKAKIIGTVEEKTQELNPREMTAKVHKDNENLIEIFDTKSGDLLGSRELSNKQNFLFRGFDWLVDGTLSTSDEFRVLTNTTKKDDGSNLERLIALSSFSDSSGKGGYSERYLSLIHI